MLIFCEHINPRIKYTFDYVFTERLGISYSIIQDAVEFEAAETEKISYASQQFKRIACIEPEGLLFEKRIRKKKPEVSYKKGIPIIFPIAEKCSFGFDLFSAVFYFLSRYEEYQPYESDYHGRFPAKESMAFKNIFLNQPVVDQWISMFRDFLLDLFPRLEFKEEIFEMIPTIDVDSPWCYRHKGIFRNGIGLIRDLIYLELKLVWVRLAILLRLKADPWFVFKWLNQVMSENNLKPLYFVHVGRFGPYDKTVSTRRLMFRRFIRNLNSQYEVALHPSYKSADKPILVKKELQRLEQILEHSVVKSRQHYLKIKLPEYYQNLIEAGITEDYSMGFADKSGFRAGTSRPFYWFDLKKSQPTKLLVVPFAVMDRTLNTYENQSVLGAKLVFDELMRNVQNVNGLFVTLWHNESFSNLFEWHGWKELFLDVMKKPEPENDD